MITSHNPEAIRQFSEDNTLLLHRHGHFEPTRVSPLSLVPINGDLVGALIRDDVEAWRKNKFRPHVMSFPEDDANRQIANGCLLDDSLDHRAIHVEPIAGGWTKVRDQFAEVYAKEMQRRQHRHMVLMIDFDEIEDRAETGISRPRRAPRSRFHRGGLVEPSSA